MTDHAHLDGRDHGDIFAGLGQSSTGSLEKLLTGCDDTPPRFAVPPKGRGRSTSRHYSQIGDTKLEEQPFSPKDQLVETKVQVFQLRH